MVDVFDRHGVRFDPRLTGCSRFVRYSDYAALEAQLAEVGNPATPKDAVPHRWECEFPGGSFFVDTKAAADVHEDLGAKITPLYVSPPAPKVMEEEWREIEQVAQPRIRDGYTAVKISRPGFWFVKGPGPAAAQEAGKP